MEYDLITCEHEYRFEEYVIDGKSASEENNYVTKVMIYVEKSE